MIFGVAEKMQVESINHLNINDMKTKFFMLAALGAVLFSCNRAEDSADVVMKEYLLTGKVPAVETKVGFDENNSLAFYWSAEDRIGVTVSSDNGATVSPSFYKMSIAGEYGTGTATFKGTLSGKPAGYVVYPHFDFDVKNPKNRHTINGTALSYYLPEEYTYTKVDQALTVTPLGTGNNFNPMMWAAIEENGFGLKHLGSMFAIYVEEMPLAEGTLTLTTNKNLTGLFSVDLSQETPVINVANVENDGTSSVSINFSGATKDAAGYFYIPCPVGAYDYLLVDIKNPDGASVYDEPILYLDVVTQRTFIKKLTVTNATLDGGLMNVSAWSTGADEGGSAE